MGPLPTGIVATILFVVRSIRVTVESRLLATQSALSPNASAAGPSPT